MQAARRFAEQDHPHTAHLVRTLDWLDVLEPRARPPLRLAALLHDIERASPDADSTFSSGRDWALSVYVDYHQGRCARLLARWLAEHGAEPAFTSAAVALVAVHEHGGWPEADLLQAADSLSFIETMSPLVLRWIADGTATRESALGKLRSMWDRIQVDDARTRGHALYERVMRDCERA